VAIGQPGQQKGISGWIARSGVAQIVSTNLALSESQNRRLDLFTVFTGLSLRDSVEFLAGLQYKSLQDLLALLSLALAPNYTRASQRKPCAKISFLFNR